MPTSRVHFAGGSQERLAARLDTPSGEARAFALFAHCFTCSKDLKSVHRLSDALTERGIAVLRFDFTGLGESEGDFSATNFSSNLEDLLAAAQYLRQEHGPPRLLIGHSLGGAAVLAAAPRIPESVAVATLGAPSDPSHLRTSLLSGADLDDSDEVEVAIGGRPFTIRRQLLEDLSKQSFLDRLKDLGRALLVLHSPVDEIVAIDHARRIFEAARHPKSFVTLDGADHLMLKDPTAAGYAGEVLAAWLSRYLPTPAFPTSDEDAADLESGEVEVRGGGGLRQRIRTERHLLTADEPRELGGTDAGPNPYELLLAALGACTSMTLRLYARRKGWPLEETVVRLRHQKIHARDCEECETKEGKLDEIERRVELHGALDDAQRARLLEIADRCPVHRTLTSEIRILGAG